MRHVSPALFARWGPTWGPLVHPERPWWRARLHVVRPSRWRLEVDSAWFRADGLRVDGDWSMSEGNSAFDVFAAVVAPRSSRIDAELAQLDAENPLPPPPPMPGQVWASRGVVSTPDEASLFGPSHLSEWMVESVEASLVRDEEDPENEKEGVDKIGEWRLRRDYLVRLDMSIREIEYDPYYPWPPLDPDEKPSRRVRDILVAGPSPWGVNIPWSAP